MKNIKTYKNFIREFVDNSKLEYNDLLELEIKIKKLIGVIENDYRIDDSDPYKELEEYPTFLKIKSIINNYYNSDYDLEKSLNIIQHLIKDMREQYNLTYVTSTMSKNDGVIDNTVDDVVFGLFPLISVALNKLSDEETHKYYMNERKIID